MLRVLLLQKKISDELPSHLAGDERTNKIKKNIIYLAFCSATDPSKSQSLLGSLFIQRLIDNKEALSTLETCAEVLEALDENPQLSEAMLNSFELLIEKAKNSNVGAKSKN